MTCSTKLSRESKPVMTKRKTASALSNFWVKAKATSTQNSGRSSVSVRHSALHLFVHKKMRHGFGCHRRSRTADDTGWQPPHKYVGGGAWPTLAPPLTCSRHPPFVCVPVWQQQRSHSCNSNRVLAAQRTRARPLQHVRAARQVRPRHGRPNPHLRTLKWACCSCGEHHVTRTHRHGAHRRTKHQRIVRLV